VFAGLFVLTALVFLLYNRFAIPRGSSANA
jgi:hypothetical protein